MDIYDRAGWPPPDENPILKLLQSGEDWIENVDVVVAIKGPDASPNQLPVGETVDAVGDLGEETRLIERESVNGRRGLRIRVYSKKGLVLIAMRARTLNAAAFRDWLADRMVEEIGHG